MKLYEDRGSTRLDSSGCYFLISAQKENRLVSVSHCELNRGREDLLRAYDLISARFSGL